jgi:DNA-binding GntR family transcriptional regulator
LQQLATRYGVDITESQLEIDVAEATTFESEHLGVQRGTPLVQVSSVDFSPTGKVGFNRTVVRSEHFYFAADMHRKTGAPTRRPLSELVARTDE